MALAGDLISTERPSNRMDIAYLFYLPFCQVFVSGDKLHRRCAPLFIRHDQEFVWAHDLKADLTRLNAYYSTLPEAERDSGIIKFAYLPPKEGDFLTARIYDRFGKHWRQEREEVKLRDPATEKALVDELTAFRKSTDTIPDSANFDDRSFNCHSLTRQIHKRKGNWWQLPKDHPEPNADHA
jgi:hypothetical protein